ncbi:hypothetical protein [Actinosynnema pretiosum]|uniref:hypothetical protein n=1 Tax=Actinosynnema pretiosum TaxID=42197 RepID=UPI0012FD642A|nr:hypothetical protein [Actinosynnema pretiosum]
MRLGVTLVGAAIAGSALVGTTACTAPSDSPVLGTGSLGPQLTSTTEVADWVRERTGECEAPEARTIAEFAEFVGPLRADLYAPFVAEWGTCAVEPYERLGLVVFHRERMADFQRAWQRAVEEEKVSGDPDFGFGNGFALSGTLGLESLGLHHLRCGPVEGQDLGHVLPADVEGCVYSRPEGHHHG